MRFFKTSTSNLVCVNIFFEGVNVTFVPDFSLFPTFSSFVLGSPSEYSCLYFAPSLSISKTNLLLRAFTTETPTPCRPPETL